MKRMKIQKREELGNRRALIFAVLLATLVSVGIGCASATITVCHSGCDYASIPAAVDAADSGDTIEVHSGTYYENVDVNKMLILKGVDTGSGKPVVDAGGNDGAITLSADGITLEGFNATNARCCVPFVLISYTGIAINSNNNTITNNTVSNNGDGIHLSSSSNNTITGNTISNNHWGGIRLDDSCSNTLTGNNVSNSNWGGIRLHSSCNNTVAGNTISNNHWGGGIRLDESCNNTITGNNVCNNNIGIDLDDSCNNTITCNTFLNDGLSVGGSYQNTSSYQNTIKNNTVNGKPLVYLEDKTGIEVTDAGQVVLVNCTNITVENLVLCNTYLGVSLLKTEESVISNNTVSNHLRGINLDYSSNNTITGNNASNNNNCGIILEYSSNNTITGNNASNNNNCGIIVEYSGNNTITCNNVSNNGDDNGIILWNSRSNKIYLNNFINNSLNVDSYNSTIIGNSTEQIIYTYNGSTYTNYLGNYWSDYKERYPDAEEIEGSGIWNTPYSIPYSQDSDNDNYPLMQPWENYLSPTGPYTKTDVGVNSKLTPASPSDLVAYLPPEYSGMDISDAVVVNVDVRDDTPENETDDAYSDITINVGELDIETCKVFKTDFGFLLEVNDITTLPTVSGDPAFSRDLANKTVTVRLYVGDPLLGVIPAAVPSVFDTGEGTYPSIMGTHSGTIIPSRDINISKMYTYPCAGTGGHSESIKLYGNETLMANGSWVGYEGDWHNITIDNTTGASYVMLLKNHKYNYTIVTGSYPQINHEPSKEVTGGTITCSSFVDVNGKVYYDWIPAIRLE